MPDTSITQQLCHLHQTRHQRCRSAAKGAEFYLVSVQGMWACYCQTAVEIKRLTKLKREAWQFREYISDLTRVLEASVPDRFVWQEIEWLRQFGGVSIIDVRGTGDKFEYYAVCTVHPDKQGAPVEDEIDIDDAI